MSRVRAPPRRGGAQLQMDVLDLSLHMDNARIGDGRLKAALDDMSNRAVRPDLEKKALEANTASDKRLEDYMTFRKALVLAGEASEAATPSATPTPPAAAGATSPKAPAGASTDEQAGTETAIEAVFTQTRPHATVLPPAAEVEIPFVLDAARCDAASVGCPVLTKILGSKSMKRLVYCDLSHNGLTDTGTAFKPFAELCSALSNLPNLRFLSFSGNVLMAPGAEALARLLRTSASLTHLDISDCSLGAAGAEELIPAFARPLPADETDEDASPTHGTAASDAALLSDLEDPEIAAIIAAAQAAREEEQSCGKKKKAAAGGPKGPSAASVGSVNDGLLWLDMSGNNLCTYGFDPKPAARLARLLMAHPALQHLNLARNRLGDGKGVAAALARGVARNRTLVSLILDDNSIDAKPAAAMASGIVDGQDGNPVSRISHLSLRGNRVRSDGASAFASLIRRKTMVPSDSAAPSPPLRFLDLRDNYIGPIGRSDLLLAMEGLPPLPEVTRGRLPGQEEEEGLDEEDMPSQGRDGTIGPEGRDRTATDVSSLALESEGPEPDSRPGTASSRASVSTGAGEVANDLPSGRSSRLADPISGRDNESTSSRAATSASEPEAGDESDAGSLSPTKRVAGGGLRAVMALRSEDGAAAAGGPSEETPATPAGPIIVTLPDGSLVNRAGHRVLV